MNKGRKVLHWRTSIYSSPRRRRLCFTASKICCRASSVTPGKGKELNNLATEAILVHISLRVEVSVPIEHIRGVFRNGEKEFRHDDNFIAGKVEFLDGMTEYLL